ncbi:hypothetical protein [Nocardia higoensis]|uniref:hypothetical protein n=1 Tax=Nocardia higoensis TaxID=228599 RepID=UPI0002E5D7DD|nr:hypothetical protein [Nocardia higoensis]
MNYSYDFEAQTAPPRPAPSRLTAFTAAVLATITGLSTAATTIFSIVVVADVANDEPSTSSTDFPDLGPVVAAVFILIGLAAGILTLLHLLGAALLFLRKTAGRVLVIIASALATALGIAGVVMDVNVGTIAATAVAATTLVLAALPSTGRWIAAGKQPPYWNGS